MNGKEIRATLKRIAGTLQSKAIVFTAEVKSIEDESCTIDYAGFLIPDVSLSAVADGNAQNLVITPKVGSVVTVVDLSGGEKRNLSIVGWTQVDTIVVNGGNNGGLVNIEDLTSKLNDLTDKVNGLIQAYNSHTHVVSTTGSASAQTGSAAAPATAVQQAQQFSKADYEDIKIKH